MLKQAVRAAFFDRRVYKEINEGGESMFLAFVVVAAVAVAFGLGIRDVTVEGFEDAQGLLVLVAISTMMVAWGLWAVVAWFVDARLLGGSASYRRLLRVLGVASGPGVLLVFLPVPFIGEAVVIIARLWMLAAGTVAVRETMGTTTLRAVIPTALGWFIGHLIFPGVMIPVDDAPS